MTDFDKSPWDKLRESLDENPLPNSQAHEEISAENEPEIGTDEPTEFAPEPPFEPEPETAPAPEPANQPAIDLPPVPLPPVPMPEPPAPAPAAPVIPELSAATSGTPASPFPMPETPVAEARATAEPAAAPSNNPNDMPPMGSIANGLPHVPAGTTPAPQRPRGSADIWIILGLAIGAILLSGVPILGLGLGIGGIFLAGRMRKAGGRGGLLTFARILAIVGTVFSILLTLGWCAVGGIVADVIQSSDADYDSPAYSETTPEAPYSDSDETAAWTVVDAAMSDIAAGDPAIADTLKADINTWMENFQGCSLADMGVDPQTYVDWILTDFEYSDDGVFVSDDTASSFLDISARDPYAMLERWEQLIYDDPVLSTADIAESAETRQKAGELFLQAMNESNEMNNPYIAFDLVLDQGEWQIDSESWDLAIWQMFLVNATQVVS